MRDRKRLFDRSAEFPDTRLSQSQRHLCSADVSASRADLSITVFFGGNVARSENSWQLSTNVSHSCKATVDGHGHEMKTQLHFVIFVHVCRFLFAVYK